jgi:hypothetical protein
MLLEPPTNPLNILNRTHEPSEPLEPSEPSESFLIQRMRHDQQPSRARSDHSVCFH